ncbi:nuclear transport factor 2 family protein [Kitasatospora sp. NPDC057738]|uniref:nuclear transport factor 2 family protein n=1 Tax=Kitasatospora sp. NPDC057738 TaxID=3346233 RepID=UPI00368A98BA
MTDTKVFARLIDAVNRKDVDGAAGCYSRDVHYAEPGINCELHGRDQVHELYKSWMTNADLTARLDDAFSAGDRGAFVFTMTGTVVNEVAGMWNADAVGRTFSVAIAVIARLDADGLMSEAVYYWDVMTMLSQLGQIQGRPESGGEAA